jgi:flagellar hook-basal body complex protein FliE
VAAIDGIGAVSSLLRTGAASPLAGAGGISGGTAPGALGGPGSIGGPGALGGPGSVGAAGAADASSAGGSFLDSLGDALGSLNTQLNAADASMASFASGGSADLHTVMLELQQASIGLKTGIAVRDRLLEAYQELMRLQI